MGGSVIFYTYGSTLELNGQQFTAGMLTADLLNLSPDEYHDAMSKAHDSRSPILAEEYEQKREHRALVEAERGAGQHSVGYCAGISCVPPAAGRRARTLSSLPYGRSRSSSDLFPKEEHEPSAEIQRRRLERVANEISARSETVKDVPLDLFHPSEAALEKGDAFYYEMLRAIGPTKGAWRDYKKYIRRYETYLHDIRAFNGTIRNFIQL